MFHVKRLREIGDDTSPRARVSRETIKPAAALSPEIIARESRERVARWLAETALQPRRDFLERIEKLAATLALWGARTNLTANPGDPGEIAFHIIDSLAPLAFAAGEERDALEAVLAADAAEDVTALDIGTGAGFPGLVLAAAFGPHFTLVEPRRKRASYLEVAAREMGLANVAVERRRATVRTVATGFGLVTARAFGKLAELCQIAGAALSPGGLLLLYASAGQALDNSAARSAGLTGPSIWTYRLSHGDRVTTRNAAMWRKRHA